MGMSFDNLTTGGTLDRVEDLIVRRRDRPARVFCPNVAIYVWAQHDPSLRRFYERCDLVTCDGRGLYFASHLLREPLVEPVSGARVMFELIPRAAIRGYKVFILGSTDNVLREAIGNLAADYPALQIVGTHHGYFTESEAGAVADAIADTAADIVFLAISTPKKERFAEYHAERAGSPLFLGVGGAIDIVAGRTTPAPRWVSSTGFEWLYRLAQEPGRLWRRYLTTNTAFAFYFLRELFAPARTAASRRHHA
jgi:N-acetylglucosaminyldiphosphoundecaprenol N-acetyl-beta-D-mannosaminyltransferase